MSEDDEHQGFAVPHIQQDGTRDLRVARAPVTPDDLAAWRSTSSDEATAWPRRSSHDQRGAVVLVPMFPR
jgi:hypothetical protein